MKAACWVFAFAALHVAGCSTDDDQAPPPDLLVAPIGGGGQSGSGGKGGSGGAHGGSTAGVGGTGGIGGDNTTGGSGGDQSIGGSGGGQSAGGDSGSGGSTPQVPCNENPWTCPAAEVCWVSDTDGNFGCHSSKAGRGKGSCCENVTGFPSCDDELMCFGTNLKPSQCIPFCDDAHPCVATDETCTKVSYFPGSSIIHVCLPTKWPMTCAP